MGAAAAPRSSPAVAWPAPTPHHTRQGHEARVGTCCPSPRSAGCTEGVCGGRWPWWLVVPVARGGSRRRCTPTRASCTVRPRMTQYATRRPPHVAGRGLPGPSSSSSRRMWWASPTARPSGASTYSTLWLVVVLSAVVLCSTPSSRCKMGLGWGRCRCKAAGRAMPPASPATALAPIWVRCFAQPTAVTIIQCSSCC